MKITKRDSALYPGNKSATLLITAVTADKFYSKVLVQQLNSYYFRALLYAIRFLQS